MVIVLLFTVRKKKYILNDIVVIVKYVKFALRPEQN